MLDVEARINELEHSHLALRRRLRLQNFGILALLVISTTSGAIAAVNARTSQFEHIVARDITVIDAKGKVRARMTSDAPDGVMAGGHVAKRGTKAAGFLIYDEEGIERGGYVTMDEGSNAMLSLDSKHLMLANLIAGPSQEGASVLNLRGGALRQMEARVDSDGARLSFFEGGVVKLQTPKISSLTPETCEDYKGLEHQYPGKNVCLTRFTETACEACLK